MGDTEVHEHDFDVRTITKGTVAGLKEAASRWQVEMAPSHFEASAVFVYGYKRRSKKYNERKQRVFGHRQELVWTGTSRDWVRTRRQQPRANAKAGHPSVRLTIRTPAHFYKVRKDLNQPNKNEELTKIIPRESRVLEQDILGHVTTEIERPKRRRRKRGG